ncbi:MAG TPA: NfeD family protein [Planctomycetaceae bacterium]|jgi:membrane-bound serine protease (ClpP class)|nr:NfeD family protein [Planctomycetaceae bacterium]
MDSGYLAILLLVVGLALIVCEVFIPSAGLIATLATLCIAGSVAAAWSAWASSNPTYFALYAMALLILIPSAISSAFYLLPRTAFGRKVLLEAPDLDEVTPYQEEQRQLMRLVGHIGKTLTMLNPGGLVEVEGTRQHCESEGLLMEAGTPVEIVAVKGNSVVVRPVEHRPPQTGDADPGKSADDSLDFDLPRS